MAVIAVGAVAALAAVFLIFKLVTGMFGGGSRGQAFAYIDDSYELMYLSDLKEKTEPLEVEYVGQTPDVQFSPDGKTVYFRDGSGALYMATVSELSRGGSPERIARDTVYFQVLENGKVLYGEYSGGARLYLFDGEDSFRLIRDYVDYKVSEDEKTIYYTEQDSDGIITLYRMDMTEDAQEEELLDGADVIYTPYDADILVYGEVEGSRGVGGNSASSGDGSGSNDGSGDGNNVTVWSCKPGEEPVELVSDVYSVLDVDVDGGSADLYYTVEDVERQVLYDLVTDTMAAEDSAAVEPARPSWYNEFYPSQGAFFDGYHWAYLDALGQTHMLDDAALIAQYGVASVADLSVYDANRAAREMAQALYNEAQADYQAKYEAYRQAASRNRIREELKNAPYDRSSFELYHYTGDENKVPIAAQVNFYRMYSDTEHGIFLYQKVSDTGAKVCDITDLEHANDVYDYLDTGSGSGEWYQTVGGTSSVLDLDSEDANVIGLYVLNGEDVVLAVEENGRRCLLAYTLGDSALTYESAVLDDDFTGARIVKDAGGKDVLYFFADVYEDDNGILVGDLVRWSGGQTETVAREIYSAAVLEESGAIYAIAEMGGGNYELALVEKDGALTTVSDEMDNDGSPIFLDGEQLLYISGGDLYLWDGEEERRVARDVENVWANVQEDYTICSANYD